MIIIFGATGDLAARKLFPALYNLAKEGRLSDKTIVVGIGRQDLTEAHYRQQIGEAIDKFSRVKADDNPFWEIFKKKIFYYRADFEKKSAYDGVGFFLQKLDQKFGCEGNRIYYLATHPNHFPIVIEQLQQHKLINDVASVPWSRVVIEKPFGTDLKTALDLQNLISRFLHEKQVFRVDHYLGKEGVQNLIALRFENSFFEPIWNNQFIDHVQITLSEDIGIGARGLFWETTGALRDLFQNHLMQLLAIAAMEPPQEQSAKSRHAEKVKLLKAIRSFPLQEMDQYVIRGQYGAGVINGEPVVGYRQENSVSKESHVETFIAATLFIDNERWAGVPFYVRGGKRMAKQMTEIVVKFKAKRGKKPNTLLIRIQPNGGIFLKLPAKVPGPDGERMEPVTFGVAWDTYFGLSSSEAYEKIFYDAIQGDSSLFVAAEEHMESWRLLTPVLQHWQAHAPDHFPNYPAGSWGPKDADTMLERNGHRWETLE